MNVPEDVIKCVVFVGFQTKDGDRHLAGSAFFVGKQSTDGHDVFLITARNVVDRIRKRGLSDVFIRANTTAGQSAWFKTRCKDWFFHPTDLSINVAVLRAEFPPELDHVFVPESLWLANDQGQPNPLGLGDEVFIVGLFRNFHGTNKNIPIVRTGHLAAMPEEKVAVRQFGLIDAYLIEARSLGEITGSPVFLHVGTDRATDCDVNQAQRGTAICWLGLVHGHYDVPLTPIDSAAKAADDVLSIDCANTGITIVVPAHKIQEVVRAYSRQVSQPTKTMTKS
jgi:hypothetical protein